MRAKERGVNEKEEKRKEELERRVRPQVSRHSLA
jgi:hypothetical protein